MLYSIKQPREGTMSDAATLVAPLVGQVRIALNQSDSSIHDPEAARKLGFRGAAVGGNNHLDLFAPLLVEAYGPEWFERGALSLYFLNVAVSGETVQAVVERSSPRGAQTRIFARRADDPAVLVCQGTASLDDHSRAELRTRDRKTGDDASLRLLRGVKPGQLLGRLELTAGQAFQDQLLRTGALNEVLDWYVRPSPWGAPIASLNATSAMMFRLLVGDGERHHHDRISPHLGDTLAMFGAFEIAFHRGPVFLDRPYEVEGRVVGVGDSPKTEYLWWDATARDERGETVVTMRHLLRFLKASSPLYGA
jgi:acyl dehydratase